MDRGDIAKLLKVIKTTYAYAFKDYTAQEANLLVDIWLEALQGIPAEVANMALMEALKKCKMPPTIADIIEIIEKQQRSLQPTNTKLWDMFYKAIIDTAKQISSFGYSFVADGETMSQGDKAKLEVENIFNRLPAVCKEYVSSPTQLIYLAKLDTEALQYEKSRFLSNVEKMHERIKTKESLQLIENKKILLGDKK